VVAAGEVMKPKLVTLCGFCDDNSNIHVEMTERAIIEILTEGQDNQQYQQQ